jgi:hypothetical protein
LHDVPTPPVIASQLNLKQKLHSSELTHSR